MLTCKTLHNSVRDFVGHFVRASHRQEQLQRFLSQGPLLLPELQLKTKLSKLSPGDDSNLIIFKAVKTYSGSGSIRRELVKDAEEFPHLHNPSYITSDFDETLNRNIVRLRTVCWLHFTKKFDNVEPGMEYCNT